ncbi:MAG: Nif3-like dinuclear metal center hexameric protein [Promethearchaeota archaeon]
MYFQQIESILQKNYPFAWKSLSFQPYLEFGEKSSNKWYSTLGISLFPSKEVIISAKKQNIHFIFTYFPLFFRPVKQISEFSIKDIKLLALSDISLYVIGNLIQFCKGGILDMMIRMSSLDLIKNISEQKSEESIPIGRLCRPLTNSTDFSYILQNLQKNFGAKNVHLWGSTKSKVERIGIFEVDSLLKIGFKVLFEENIEVIVTSDLSLNWIWKLVNLGITVISIDSLTYLTHGLENFSKQLSVLMPRMKIEYIPYSLQRLVI